MNELTGALEFDFVIMADRAEMVGGKLYMMGGAWDGIIMRQVGDVSMFSVAVGVGVPWAATNMQHTLTLRIVDADANELARAQVEFTTGRPPQLAVGTRQRAAWALPMVVAFPGPGTYALVCTVGTVEKRIPFTVQLAPPQAFQPPSRPAY
ncbi:MAG TPA: hypothetical protein VFE42_35455 [Chloroflexota bacterium]|nr:hypothetical protein [Chloroflexota bacterium]